MDNYFNECPAMMNDSGRSVGTDYRSATVREQIFRYKNCTISENDARTLRIENGERILDNDWVNLRKTNSCFPRKKCYHKHPTTKVSTAYNNAEILAYNNVLPAPSCDVDNYADYRATQTVLSNRQQNNPNPYYGYPPERCPRKCAKTNRLLPDGLYLMNSD